MTSRFIVPSTSTHRVLGFLPLLVSLFCSAWLLSTRTLGVGAIWNAVGELPALLILTLAFPAFVGAFVLSILHLLWLRNTGHFSAILPLLLNVVAVALFFFAPLDEIVARRDFQTYYGERMDVVRRVESGELWSGQPLISLVNLPPEYSRSVSNGTGQRAITVYRDQGVLHVVFYPMSGLLGQTSAFLYRSDGDSPPLPDRHLPNAIQSEPLGDHWYRVVFRPLGL